MAKTIQDIELTAWGKTFVLPAGSRVHLVKGLDGRTSAGYVVSDVSQLIELTGNSHDPKYRYVVVPREYVEGSE